MTSTGWKLKAATRASSRASTKIAGFFYCGRLNRNSTQPTAKSRAMQEQTLNWLTEVMKIPGVLACCVRAPDRKTVTRSNSNRSSCLRTFRGKCLPLASGRHVQVIVIRIASQDGDTVRMGVRRRLFPLWRCSRADGHCLALLTRRKTAPNLQQRKTWNGWPQEFQQLET